MNDIDTYIRKATSSLKGDSEIQLEVEQELRSHIETSIKDGVENENREDAESRALKEMGSPELIKDELLEAHTSRMKLKSRAFLFIQALAIPALIITMTWSLLNDSIIGPAITNKNPAKEFAHHNDDKYIQQWKADPSGMNFYQMYNHCQWTKQNIHILKKELIKAQELYPNNAWFDYVDIYINNEYTDPQELDSFRLSDQKSDQDFLKVWNLEKVQRSIKILEQAENKKEFNSYMSDYILSSQNKMDTLSSSKNILSYFYHISHIDFRECRSHLNITPILIHRISNLRPEKDAEEIQRHLDTLLFIINSSRKDSTLVHYLTSIAISNQITEHLGDSIHKYNLTPKTKRRLAKLSILMDQQESWKSENNTTRKNIKADFEKNAQYQSPMILVNGSLTTNFISDEKHLRENMNLSDEIKEFRQFFYSVIDRHFVQITAFILSALSLALYIRIFLFQQKSAHKNLKLSLGLKENLKLVIGSIIIPLALYISLYILNEHGSRAWSPTFGLPYTILEILTLTSTIIIAPLYFTAKAAHTRSIEIGIESKSPSKTTKLILFVLGINWSYMILSKLNYFQYENMWQSWQNIIAVTLSAVLVCCIAYQFIIRPIITYKTKNKLYTYTHTLAKAQIVYTIFPIMVCLFLTNLGMKEREKRLLTKWMTFENGERALWSKTEDQICNYLAQQFDKVFSEKE